MRERLSGRKRETPLSFPSFSNFENTRHRVRQGINGPRIIDLVEIVNLNVLSRKLTDADPT
jgi:hypothetical protein